MNKIHSLFYDNYLMDQNIVENFEKKRRVKDEIIAMEEI